MTSAAALGALSSGPINNVCSMGASAGAAPSVIKTKEAELALTSLARELVRRATSGPAPDLPF